MKSTLRRVSAAKARTGLPPRKGLGKATEKGVRRRAGKGLGRGPGAERPAIPAADHRKNPRIVEGLIQHGRGFCESFFETASSEQIIHIIEESYCSSLVSLLLDLKSSTVKRIFEAVPRHRRRNFADVLSLYYYEEYLTNPLPLTLMTESGGRYANHYAVLGVPRDATLEELKQAEKFLEAALAPEAFPPDGRGAAASRLREIDEAFRILKDPARRKALDVHLPPINYLYPRREQCWYDAVTRLTV